MAEGTGPEDPPPAVASPVATAPESSASTLTMTDLAIKLGDIAAKFGELNTNTTMDFEARKELLRQIREDMLTPLIVNLKKLGNAAPTPAGPPSATGITKAGDLFTLKKEIIDLKPDEAFGGGKGKSKSSRGPSKDKRKKKGGADINFDTMGSQVMNTGDLLNNQYMANLVPRAWDGPSPFSAGSTLAETITKGIPDSLVNAMDPPIVRGGGKKKSSSSKKSSSASKPSKSKK